MRYSDVCVEAISYVLPGNVVTSAAIEKWLKPLYDRLNLPEGRLEMMTGIRERRFWANDALPSECSTLAAQKALELAAFAASRVECLLHCSVSRDFVEPATSTSVHRRLGLPGHALNFDVSNACLGALSGVILLANMIQLGQARAGLVVAGENSKPLVDATVRQLVSDTSLDRQSIKPYFASLTIGSAASAVLLTHASLSQTGHRLLGGAHWANTGYNHLCQGSSDTAMTGDSAPMMHTDAQELLVRGVEVAQVTWGRAKEELQWSDESPDVICSHQVSRAHREELYRALALDGGKDFSSFEFLGNCGAASLPATTAMAVEEGRVKSGDRLALLGIGSGINCTMLGIEW